LVSKGYAILGNSELPILGGIGGKAGKPLWAAAVDAPTMLNVKAKRKAARWPMLLLELKLRCLIKNPLTEEHSPTSKSVHQLFQNAQSSNI
jgi:hypothetical protein